MSCIIDIACCNIDRSWICRKYLKNIGTGCDMISVSCDSDIVDSVTMTGCLHLEFIFQGGWMGQG
jgi:hypothetical protein